MKARIYAKSCLWLGLAALVFVSACDSSGILDTKSRKSKKCSKVENFDTASNVSERDQVIYGNVSSECGALLSTSISSLKNDAFKKTLLLILPGIYSKDSETSIALGDDVATAKVLAHMKVTSATALSPAVTIDDDPTILTGKMQLALFRDASTSLSMTAPVFEYVVGVYKKSDKTYVSVVSDFDTFENDDQAVLAYPEAFGTYQLISTTTQVDVGSSALP